MREVGVEPSLTSKPSGHSHFMAAVCEAWSGETQAARTNRGDGRCRKTHVSLPYHLPSYHLPSTENANSTLPSRPLRSFGWPSAGQRQSAHRPCRPPLSGLAPSTARPARPRRVRTCAWRWCRSPRSPCRPKPRRRGSAPFIAPAKTTPGMTVTACGHGGAAIVVRPAAGQPGRRRAPDNCPSRTSRAWGRAWPHLPRTITSEMAT